MREADRCLAGSGDRQRFFEFAHLKTPCFSILDPRFSRLETRTSQRARREFRGSSRDCQLTFEGYCSSFHLNVYI